MSGQKFISEAPGSRGEPALLQEAAGTVGWGKLGRSRVMTTRTPCFGDGGLESCLFQHAAT